MMVNVLDWALGLFPRFISSLGGFTIAPGVSILTFSAAMIIIIVLIYAFVPRP